MNNDMLKPTSLIQRQNNSNAKINEDGKDQNSSLTVSSADISCETGDDLVSTEAGRSRLPTFVDSDLSVGISFPSRSIPSDDVETRSAASDGFTFSTHCSKEVSTSESGHIGSGTARRRRRQRRRRTCSEGDRLQQNQRQLFASLLLPNVLTPAPVRVQRRLSYVQPLGTSHMLDSGYGTISHRKEHIPARDVVKEEKISESEESEEQEEEFSSEESDVSSKSHPLTAKDWITICMLAMANLCSTTAFSCLAPFYPAEARIKGMDDTQTGIVFGIFELVMFLSAPVLGRNVSCCVGSCRDLPANNSH
ncbi:hypothetical protein AB6A40_010544 [Gnathostoma spinigerum]|uniref:Uncharacterized protein n=1 Tax=Gnathostoma spinigerum TaxID=75299 RepID=A0ABD6F3G3_9BILA